MNIRLGTTKFQYSRQTNRDNIKKGKIWHKGKLERRKVIKNRHHKRYWDQEFKLRKTETAGRPDMILRVNEKKIIWIEDGMSKRKKWE